MTVLIGTSGWQYRDWRGRFYPQRMPQRLWLEHYAAHFATVENLRYFTDVGDAQTRAQFYRATVDGQQVEAATRVEVNDQAQISEITIYYRPLPGLTALTATLGSHVVAARHGHRRALTARLLFAPLALVIRFGDHFATWFA